MYQDFDRGSVREGVAENPTTPVEVVEIVTEDKVANVREVAYRVLADRRDSESTDAVPTVLDEEF